MNHKLERVSVSWGIIFFSLYLGFLQKTMFSFLWGLFANQICVLVEHFTCLNHWSENSPESKKYNQDIVLFFFYKSLVTEPVKIQRFILWLSNLFELLLPAYFDKKTTLFYLACIQNDGKYPSPWNCHLVQNWQCLCFC